MAESSNILINDNSLLVWDNSLSVGVDEIDSQHMAIIATLNNVIKYAATKDNHDKYSMAEKLEDFMWYIDKHFLSEEFLMEYINYPEYEEHKESHEKMRKIMLSWISEIKNNTVKNEDVIKAIKKWLIDHIKIKDVAIGTYVYSNPVASKKVEKHLLKELF